MLRVWTPWTGPEEGYFRLRAVQTYFSMPNLVHEGGDLNQLNTDHNLDFCSIFADFADENLAANHSVENPYSRLNLFNLYTGLRCGL